MYGPAGAHAAGQLHIWAGLLEWGPASSWPPACFAAAAFADARGLFTFYWLHDLPGWVAQLFGSLNEERASGEQVYSSTLSALRSC